MTHRRPRRAVSHRLARLVTAVSGFAVGFSLVADVARGAPGAVLALDRPGASAAPPTASPLEGHEYGVSSQSGAFGYTYSIAVPPGRRGMAPGLALAYSSQGAAHGGIADRWHLPIPEISLDTRDGLLRKQDSTQADTRWKSSLAGEQALVPIGARSVIERDGRAATVSRFRAEHDTSFAEYMRMPDGSWTVLTMDGHRHRFGETEHMGGYDASVRMPLTSTSDIDGNTIVYKYKRFAASVGEGYYLDEIQYTANPRAGLAHHARVELVYASVETCGAPIPVGASLDHRTGTAQIHSPRQLVEIRTQVRDQPGRGFRDVRRVVLRYDENKSRCDAPRAPTRELVEIEETAWNGDGEATTLPAVSFGYGSTKLSFAGSLDRNFDLGDRSLSRGHSPGRRSSKRGPEVTEMLLDFDGDGIQDILKEHSVGGTCSLEWYRGTGSGFAGPQPVELPQVAWTNGSLPAGRPDAEGCALNGQFTTRVIEGREPPPSDDCPQTPVGNYLLYRWVDVIGGDGRPELVTALEYDDLYYHPGLDAAYPQLTTGSGEVMFSVGGQTSPTTPGVGPINPTDDITDDGRPDWEQEPEPWLPVEVVPPPPFSPEPPVDPNGHGAQDRWDPGAPTCLQGREREPERFGAGYVWRVYENLGEGRLSDEPQVVVAPIPLTGAGGDGFWNPAMRPGTLFSGFGEPEGLFDLDGDGFLDAVQDSGTTWKVWRGNGRGGFDARPDGSAFEWPAPAHGSLGFGRVYPGPYSNNTETYAALLDVNADGLVDLVTCPAPAEHGACHADKPWLEVFFNRGAGFALTPQRFLSGAPVVFASLARSETARRDGTWWRQYRRRMLDMDSDGLPDQVRFTDDGLEVLFNRGGTLGPPVGYPASDAVRYAVLGHAFDNGGWKVRGDVLDLNADGVADAVYDGSVRRLHVSRAPRLLGSVDNGRGGLISIEYKAHTAYPRMPGRRTTAPVMVASRVTVQDASTQVADQETAYIYEGPIHNQDPRGDWGFRGFQRVTTVDVDGSREISEFDYELDWSGRVERSITMLSATEAHSIVDSRYAPFDLYGGRVRVYQPDRTETRICPAKRSVAQCESAEPKTSETAYRTFEDPWIGEVMMVLPERTTEFAGLTIATGARRQDITYELAFNANQLQTRTKTVETRHLTEDGVWLRHGFAESFYDTRGHEIATEVMLDADGTIARTESCYDADTGVLRATRNPRQVEAEDRNGACFDGQPALRHTYDAWQLYAMTTVQERANARLQSLNYRRVIDLGTGQPTMEAGPYQPGKGWPTTIYELDGLGRTTKVTRSTDAPSGSYYVRVPVMEVSYLDHARPQQVITRTRIDLHEDRWITSGTKIAGGGEVTSEFTETEAGSVTASYFYGPDGNVARVRAPNPAHDSNAGASSSVDYRYEYDALGRLTAYRPPLGAAHTVRYDGLTTTRSQAGMTDGSVAAPTKLEHDVLGRLRKVHELTDGDGWAITTYDYDANDHVEQIVAAGDSGGEGGIETVLEHDYAGRRVGVHRGGRSWRYAYDIHGNLRSKTIPYDGPASQFAAYSVAFAYDDLDRPTSKVVGSGGMSRGSFNRWGSNPVTTYRYDEPGHGSGFGRLTSVALPHGSLRYHYTVEGHASRIERQFAIDPFLVGDVSDSRSIDVTYDALGNAKQVRHADGTLTLAEVDERGLPRSLKLWGPRPGSSSTGWWELAAFTRGKSGVPIARTGGGKSRVSWTYDANSRVTGTTIDRLVCVRAAPPPAPGPITGFGTLSTVGTSPSTSGTGTSSGLIVGRILLPVACDYTGIAGESIGWDEVGNVRRVDNLAHGHSLTYGYDSQHQLKIAASRRLAGFATSTGDAAYAAYFDYFPDGRVREVDIGAANEDIVKPRHVRYDYDPEARVDELVDPGAVQQLTRLDVAAFGGEAAMAGFHYDASGNLVSRAVDGEVRAFVYDVEGRLREARHDGATEYYYYDHAGQRQLAARTAYKDAPARIKQWFGAAEIEYSTRGAVTETELHLALGGSPVAIIRNGDSARPEYTFNGSLGSLLAVLDKDGAPLATYSYGPFGELLETAGERPGDYDRLYNGKVFDDLSGLSYYGHRYYDRLTLTWISQDPKYRFAPDAAWDEPRRMSLYAFNLNSPLVYVDPDGLDGRRGAGGASAFQITSAKCRIKSKCKPKGSKGKKRKAGGGGAGGSGDPAAGAGGAGGGQDDSGDGFGDGVENGTGGDDGMEQEGYKDGTRVGEIGLFRKLIGFEWSLGLLDDWGPKISTGTEKAIDGAQILATVVLAAVGAVSQVASRLGVTRLSRFRFTGTAKKARWAKARQGVDGPGVRDHFQKHGDQVGARTAREYDASARATIQDGRRFKYRDPTTKEPRVGYYDPDTGLFTATAQTRKTPTILTHFPESWDKIRRWPGFATF